MSEDTKALLAVVLTGICTGVLTVCGVTELEKRNDARDKVKLQRAVDRAVDRAIKQYKLTK